MQYKCLDCGKQLVNHRSKRCLSCANKGKNNPNYKHGKNIGGKTCQECGKGLSRASAEKCQKCAAKYNLGVFKSGVNHLKYKDGKSNTKEYKRNYSKWYRESNLQVKLRCRVGSLLRNYLRKRKVIKSKKLLSILPYTIEELKEHLESKFKKGMSWDNMKLWHIDHIIPDSYFNYNNTDDKEFKKSWSLNNLQPLWAKENLQKGKTIL